jgi:hypothetical protein
MSDVIGKTWDSGDGDQRRAVREGCFPAVRQQRSRVIEEDDAVAEEAPALFGMTDAHARGRAVRCQCFWAPGVVRAHIVLRHYE